MLTIKEALAEAANLLAPMSCDARREVEWLLAHVTGVTRANLFAYPEKMLTAQEQQAFLTLLERRQRGEPLAYLLGRQPFWTLNLRVTPDTLIPRPETEVLVAWILAHYPLGTCLRVADLGVGSGAIALALASERPTWEIDATDRLLATLQVAEQNAQELGMTQVNFFQGDWCSALPKDKRYDIIVSNPPYIACQDPHLVDLRHEPYAALVSEQAGMADLVCIMQQSRAHLVLGGKLIVEHGFTQRVAVQEALAQAGYGDILAFDDLEHRPRFVVATWSGD